MGRCATAQGLRVQGLSIHCDLNEGTIGGMQIDVARRTDVDRIVGLVNDAYRGTSRAPGWTHETHLFTGARIDAAAVTGMIQPDRSTVLVMRQEDAIIACVGLQRLDDREWYLSMLAVDPAARRSLLAHSHQAPGLEPDLR